MPRPISATISPSALRRNLTTVRQHLARAATGTPPSIWAVIKANAYGHGIERAVVAFGDAAFGQAQGLAMLDLNEAVRCREAGWRGPVLLLEGFFEPPDLKLVDHYSLTVAIHSREQLDMLQRARPAQPIAAYIKFNSGMNRLGFTSATYRDAYARALQLAEQNVLGRVGKMTHFANADTDAGVAEPLAAFDAVTKNLPGPVSVCNSAALLRHTQVACRSADEASWVRPGICLYGGSPFADVSAASFGLLPTMTLTSKLIAVQALQPGDQVGYGGAFSADAPMRVGVVACGYADGYPRHAPTGTPVTVAGVRSRVVGRVSMDMLTVDLTPVPAARVGSPVVLWGDGGPSVDEVAASARTIGYELLCAVAPRVPVSVSQ